MEVAFIICIVIICLVALGLVAWLIVTLTRGKKETDAGRVVVVDEKAYVLVPVGERGEAYVEAAVAAAPAPAEQPAAPAEQPAAPAEQPVEQPAEEAAPEAPETPAETPAEQPEEAEAAEEDADLDGMVLVDPEGMVMLRRNESVPYPEAYEALSSIEKSCVDEIIAYAEGKEGTKKVINDRSASVYYGKKLLVRIILRRGKITARLTVQNNDFVAYADKEGLSIKNKPVDVRVETADNVDHIKGMLDITYGDFTAERARRDEEKREARREARRLKREAQKRAEEEAAGNASQPETTEKE